MNRTHIIRKVMTAAAMLVMFLAVPVCVHADGSYDGNLCTFVSQTGSGTRVLDISAASDADFANLQIYRSNRTAAQAFRLEKVSGEYYRITNIKSGKVIDVYAGRKGNMSNVNQYHWNGSDAQLWKIQENGDGTVSLLNKGSGRVLDVCAGADRDCANVWIYNYNGTPAQKFRLQEASLSMSGASVTGIDSFYFYEGSDITPSPTVRIGAYELVEGVDYEVSYSGNTAGCIKGSVTVTGKGSFTGSVTKTFSVIDLTSAMDISGTYTLLSDLDTGKVIDIAGGSAANGAAAQLYSSNGTDAQAFTFVPTGDGAYYIMNELSGKVLDVMYGSASNGAQVWQYTKNGSKAQMWYVLGNPDGTVSLVNKGSGKALDIPGARCANGVRLQQYTLNGSKAQRFHLHEHDFQMRYETVHHEAVTHIENKQYTVVEKVSNNDGGYFAITESHTICGQCGIYLDVEYEDKGLDLGIHYAFDSPTCQNYHTQDVVIGYEYREPTYRDEEVVKFGPVTVVDREAYDSEEPRGIYCTTCGVKKPS